MLFGATGYGFFLYGKKQRTVVPLAAGVVLCVCLYFIESVYVLVAVGLVLVTIPYLACMRRILSWAEDVLAVKQINKEAR